MKCIDVEAAGTPDEMQDIRHICATHVATSYQRQLKLLLSAHPLGAICRLPQGNGNVGLCGELLGGRTSGGSDLGLTPETYGAPLGGRLSGARILVVEDEFVIAMQLQSLFEEEGAQVLGPYHNLSDALAHAGNDDISAASLDVNLGRETAAPVASLLAERKVPFVFYSVQTNDPSLSDWRHVRLIQKPAAPSELIEAIAALVRLRATETAE